MRGWSLPARKGCQGRARSRIGSRWSNLSRESCGSPERGRPSGDAQGSTYDLVPVRVPGVPPSSRDTDVPALGRMRLRWKCRQVSHQSACSRLRAAKRRFSGGDAPQKGNHDVAALQGLSPLQGFRTAFPPPGAVVRLAVTAVNLAASAEIARARTSRVSAVQARSLLRGCAYWLSAPGTSELRGVVSGRRRYRPEDQTSAMRLRHRSG